MKGRLGRSCERRSAKARGLDQLCRTGGVPARAHSVAFATSAPVARVDSPAAPRGSQSRRPRVSIRPRAASVIAEAPCAAGRCTCTLFVASRELIRHREDPRIRPRGARQARWRSTRSSSSSAGLAWIHLDRPLRLSRISSGPEYQKLHLAPLAWIEPIPPSETKPSPAPNRRPTDLQPVCPAVARSHPAARAGHERAEGSICEASGQEERLVGRRVCHGWLRQSSYHLGSVTQEVGLIRPLESTCSRRADVPDQYGQPNDFRCRPGLARPGVADLQSIKFWSPLGRAVDQGAVRQLLLLLAFCCLFDPYD